MTSRSKILAMRCKRLGGLEKKTYGYQERDEAGIDNRSDHPYGYSPKGERVYALKDGRRTERVSWIAALKGDKVFAPMTFDGTYNRMLMELWLEDSLLPPLEIGDVIVMDNASFHKGQAIEDLVLEAGREILYLPSYSPDLNDIEHWWFPLKNKMRKTRDKFDTFRDCVDAAFLSHTNVYS
jgi:transposase